MHRLLDACLSLKTFAGFVAAYASLTLSALFVEEILVWRYPSQLGPWTLVDEAADLNTLMLNVASYLITAQVGALGVISIAIALVTLIAQRENSSTDIQVYYHQSLAFEVVASCIALLAVLCAQLLWPMQTLLHFLGLGNDLPIFKLIVLAVHLLWLLLNLAALAHFIATTFAFVQQSERERLRERYTARVVFPQNTTKRLREQLYQMATNELLDGGKEENAPAATFGFDFGLPSTIEIQSDFRTPVALDDVRIIWVRWAIRRWARRCTTTKSEAGVGGLRNQSPQIWFLPHFDAPLHGTTGWCRRRGGPPLTKLEKFVLRRAFRFKRIGDEE